MKIQIPGIYRDFDGEAYFADPCPEPSFSQSIGKIIIERSPLHGMWEHPRLAPPVTEDEEAEKYDKAKAIGNAAHAIMLGRGKTITVIGADSFRSKDAQTKRDEAVAAGNVPILEKHMADAEAMVKAAWAQLDHHEAKDAFRFGAGEVVLAWQEDGLWFRCMVDWLHDDMLVVDDFKTTGMSVAPHVVGMMMVNAGWDIQAAMIERGLDVLHPQTAGRRRYRFIAQENERPFALTVAQMGEAAMTMGRKKLDAAVTLWREAVETNTWRGYTNRVVVPEYPGFRESQWLDREIAGEFETRRLPQKRAPMLTDRKSVV